MISAIRYIFQMAGAESTHAEANERRLVKPLLPVEQRVRRTPDVRHIVLEKPALDRGYAAQHAQRILDRAEVWQPAHQTGAEDSSTQGRDRVHLWSTITTAI